MSTNNPSPPGRLDPRRMIAVGAALLAAVATALVIFVSPGPLYFSDPLTGPASLKLSIPTEKYGYTPQGLSRIQSDGRLDRPMVKTVSGNYLTIPHFTAEVSVNLAAGDIAFIGLGQAMNDPNHFSEPSNCFLFRIHNLAETRIDIAAAQSGRDTHFVDIRNVSVYVGGTTTRFRIARDGDYVTLSIPSENVRRTYSLSQYRPQLGLTNENTYLFFGNIAPGTIFSDFRVTRTAPDTDAAPPGRR